MGTLPGEMPGTIKLVGNTIKAVERQIKLMKGCVPLPKMGTLPGEMPGTIKLVGNTIKAVEQ